MDSLGFLNPLVLFATGFLRLIFSLSERLFSASVHTSLQAMTAEPFSQGGWPKAQASQGIQDVREVFSSP